MTELYCSHGVPLPQCPDPSAHHWTSGLDPTYGSEHAGTTTEHEVASTSDEGQPPDPTEQEELQGEPAPGAGPAPFPHLIDPFDIDLLGEPGLRFAVMSVIAAAQLWHMDPESELRTELLHASIQLYQQYSEDVRRGR